jgi:hypothetical protein
VRYGDLAQALAVEGLALHNLASLPHISVAGAVATATHGSGDANGNLATAVAGLELVTSSGELLTVARGAEDFNGLVVGLGSLGAVTRVTLDVEPAYEVRQRVFEGLAWDALDANFDAVMMSGYSVSLFTRWGTEVDQVWVKARVSDEFEAERAELFGARAATVERHPILGIDPLNCTSQLGVPGRWSDRLPHFRMGFTPSSGDELQSEFFVPRERAVEAIGAVRQLADTIRPVLQVSEIRTIAADDLWMSPQYGRDSVGIHFTWRRDQAAVERRPDHGRGGAGAVRRPPALGQGLRGRSGDHSTVVSAPRRLRPSRRPTRPAPSLPERLARAPRAGCARGVAETRPDGHPPRWKVDVPAGRRGGDGGGRSHGAADPATAVREAAGRAGPVAQSTLTMWMSSGSSSRSSGSGSAMRS